MDEPITDAGVKKGRDIASRAGSVRQKISEETAESQINLIGLRVDETLPRLEKFLNHATLAGLSEVTIIHGIGTGALAKAVREHLSEHPLVKSKGGGEQSEGGGGVTVVVLK